MNNIVTTQWLDENRNSTNLIILDASFNRVGVHKKVDNLQIPKARYFDLKKVFSNQDSILPNTIPNPHVFQQACQNIGVNKSSTIIVYDNKGIYTSPRVWWLFKLMGFDKIAVLDGGLPAWIEDGFVTVSIVDEIVENGDFEVGYRPKHIKFIHDIDRNINNTKFKLIDVRSPDRYYERVVEPRQGLRGGHIPNSVNLFYKEVLMDGKYKSMELLKELLGSYELGNKPLVFSCGSGITACIVLLAVDMVLEQDMAVYDGSWTEWGTLRKS